MAKLTLRPEGFLAAAIVYTGAAYWIFGFSEVFEVLSGPRGLLLGILYVLGLPCFYFVCLFIPPGPPHRPHFARITVNFLVLMPCLLSLLWWWAHEKTGIRQTRIVDYDTIRPNPPAVEHTDPPVQEVAASPMGAHLDDIVALSYVDIPGEQTLAFQDSHGCQFRVKRDGRRFLVEDGRGEHPVDEASADVGLLEMKVNNASRASIQRYAGELQRAIEARVATVTDAGVDRYDVSMERLSARVVWRLNAPQLDALEVWEDGAEQPRLRLERGPVRERGGWVGTERLATALGRRVARP